MEDETKLDNNNEDNNQQQQQQQQLADISSPNMAPFLTKLFQIVSAANTDPCITWTPKGDSFVISDPDTFAREILPTYFKHNNIRSFIRQLNTYGFRKRTNISSTDEHLEFFHEKFKRDQPSLLMQIKRCHQPKPSARAPPAAASAQDAQAHEASVAKVLPDVEIIRSRVSELKTRLGLLQSEIRDYNAQIEHKVNLLMQILQSNTPAQTALQLQTAMLQDPRNAGGQHHKSADKSGGSGSIDMQGGGGGGSSLLGGVGEPHLGLGGLNASFNPLGFGGGMGGIDSSLIGSLSSLSGVYADGLRDVPGLQSLLAAAQRSQTEEASRS